MSLPDRYKVHLLVKDGEPAGVEGVIGQCYGWVPNWTSWTWQRAGGPLNLVTAPDGTHWGFVPGFGRFCMRPSDPSIKLLEGTIEQIPDPAEWQGLVRFQSKLEQVWIQALSPGGDPVDQTNTVMAACFAAATSAYRSILIGECPWIASNGALYVDLDLATDVCSIHFRGDVDGYMDNSGPLFWQCHQKSGHAGDCNAALAVQNHCCTGSVFPSARDSFTWPYPRANFWAAATGNIVSTVLLTSIAAP